MLGFPMRVVRYAPSLIVFFTAAVKIECVSAQFVAPSTSTGSDKGEVPASWC
jgi:hypothetical protein